MSRPSPFRLYVNRLPISEISVRKAKDLESIAQLVEDMIPSFKKEEERQFYLEVVQSYRAAARDVQQRELGNQGPVCPKNTNDCKSNRIERK